MILSNLMQTIAVRSALPGRLARNAFSEPPDDIMTRRHRGPVVLWRALFPHSTGQSNNNFDARAPGKGPRRSENSV